VTRLFLLFLPLAFLRISCAPAHDEAPAAETKDRSSLASLYHYDLDQPAARHKLPDILHEISGMAWLGDSTVACVQDELGTIFFYRLDEKTITRKIPFSAGGDYEGLTLVDSLIYVLESKGTLLEIDPAKKIPLIDSYTLDIPTSNNEGLVHDPRNGRLLVAAKSKPGKGPQYKDSRMVYGFDLRKKELFPAPVLNIDVQAIRDFAGKKNLDLPKKQNKKTGSWRDALRFFPSAVAVHPFTQEMYILSANDHTVAVFDAQGNVTAYALLDAALFNKPESLTFLPNGDMIIGNEGQGGVPTLLVFHWKN